MSRTKRQYLPPKSQVFIVATPIGNLQDLTLRARDVLTEVSKIYCEDTRQTLKLLAALGISKKLERLDAHATPARLKSVVETLLETGESVAVVTDAGTPGVSDPAAAFVRAAREAGIGVMPVPGPSAVTTLLSVAGFIETSFTFCGFFPRKKGDIERTIAEACASATARVHVWYESPQRIAAALALVAEAVPEAEAVAGKELTKLHEKLFWGSATEVSQAVIAETETEGERGEWCFAVRFPLVQKESGDWLKELRVMLADGVSVSDAARKVSQRFGIARKQVYETALDQKKNQKRVIGP